MPISVKAEKQSLRTSQLRVLAALRPSDPTLPVSEWPLFTRTTMRVVCGMSPTNSMNRLLHGVKEGDGSHLGLVGLGLIEAVELNIDGVIEYNYRITPRGVKEYNACLKQEAQTADRCTGLI